jgi:PadR family transcriptional regulator, regulatory protein AphA
LAGKPESSRATPYVILGVLNTFGPLSGYGVKQVIAQTIDFMWSESYGQLYPELKRLARDGLVRQVSERGDNPRGRKTFAITGAGRRTLSTWLRQRPARELVRVEHLVKLFFGRAAGVKASRLQVLAVKEKQLARLAQFAAIRAQIESAATASPDFVNWMIVLRSGEMQAEMRVRWAEEALALLDAWERGGANAVLATSRTQRGRN